MKTFISNKRLLAAGVAAAAALSLAACAPEDSASPPPGMCSFVVGDGQEGRDRAIKEIAYPSEDVDYDSTREDVHFIPCQPRNFEVNDGSKRNNNGDQVGDRFTETQAFTSGTVVTDDDGAERTRPGTRTFVSWTAYWEVNQSEAALRDFYELCTKYRCYNTQAEAGGVNFSTPGWNGLLGENFAPSGDDAVKQAMEQFDDSIWETPSQAQLDALALAASNNFAEKVRLRTGTDLDLFCGSGNSGWDDPNNPGEGTYECTNVRFVINSVRGDNTAEQQSEQQRQTERERSANTARLDAARELYGDDAEYWLGLQDSLAICGDRTTCVVTIGDPPSGAPSIGVDVTPPATEPSGAPEAPADGDG